MIKHFKTTKEKEKEKKNVRVPIEEDLSFQKEEDKREDKERDALRRKVVTLETTQLEISALKDRLS